MRGIKYFFSRLKSHIKASPVVVLVSLLTAAAAAFAAFALIKNAENSKENEKAFTCGVVGDMTQRYLLLAIDTLNNLDDSRLSIQFEVMEEDEARGALESGDIIGYLRIPDGFIEAAARAEFIPAEYVSEGLDTALGDSVVAEFIKIADSLADYAQRGVFGAEAYFADRGVPWSRLDGVSDVWTARYIAYLMNRTNVLDIRNTSEEAVPVGGYYFSAFALLFAMLFGVGCAAHLVKKDYSLPKLLASRRIGAVRQILCELLAYFIFLYFFLVVICVLGGAVLDRPSLYGVTGGKTFSGFVAFAFALAPAAAMIASAQIFIYEIASGVVEGVLLQFTAVIATAYISGYFYPSTFFPESVQKVALALPGGAAFTYAKSIYGTTGAKSLFPLILFTLLFASASVLVRKIKTGGDNN